MSSLDAGGKLFLSRRVKGESGEDLVEKQNAEQGLMPVVGNEAAEYGYEGENRHFAQPFLDGRQPELDFEAGLAVTELLMAAYMSAEQERVVAWRPERSRHLRARGGARDLEAMRRGMMPWKPTARRGIGVPRWRPASSLALDSPARGARPAASGRLRGALQREGPLRASRCRRGTTATGRSSTASSTTTRAARPRATRPSGPMREFGDFVLRVDWRIKETPYVNPNVPIIRPDGTHKKGADGKEIVTSVPDSDSGIFLRGGAKSQVNIWCWPIGSGEVYGYRMDEAMPTAVRAGVTPKLLADRDIGQWNTFEITMKGDRLTVVLNGKTVIENAQLPGVAARGPIALQHHGEWKDGRWAGPPRSCSSGTSTSRRSGSLGSPHSVAVDDGPLEHDLRARRSARPGRRA